MSVFRSLPLVVALNYGEKRNATMPDVASDPQVKFKITVY